MKKRGKKKFVHKITFHLLRGIFEGFFNTFFLTFGSGRKSSESDRMKQLEKKNEKKEKRGLWEQKKAKLHLIPLGVFLQSHGKRVKKIKNRVSRITGYSGSQLSKKSSRFTHSFVHLFLYSFFKLFIYLLIWFIHLIPPGNPEKYLIFNNDIRHEVVGNPFPLFLSFYVFFSHLSSVTTLALFFLLLLLSFFGKVF